MEVLLNILFVCIFSILVLGMTMIRTSDEEVSFIKSVIVNIWTVISLGAALAFVMDLLSIPIMVRSMAAAYGICAVFVWGYLLKGRTKRIQKFVFHWSDFFSIICCIMIWGYVFIKVFGFDFTIAYNNVDAGTHFKMANEILGTHRLNRMYFAALYNSLVMELLQPFLIKETMYKAFIIADASLNLLNILMFYVLASEFVKSKFSKAVLPAIMIFYFFGWPVWSWIAGGFVYFGAGVTAYIYGIYVLYQVDKSNGKTAKIYYCVLTLLALFSIIECYLLFTPIFLLTVIGYALYENWDKLTKKYLIYGIGCIVIISAIAFALIYWGYFHGKANAILKFLKTDGGVHRELYKDFMFLLPVNAYICVVKYKEKRIDLLTISIILQFVVTALALVANVCGVMSDYYYFKLYYLGWALQFVGVACAIEYFWNEKKQVVYFCILPIVMAAILETTGLSQNIIWSTSGNSEMFPVITQSMIYIKSLHDNNSNRKGRFITVCKWVNDNLSEESVPMATNFNDVLMTWYTAITGENIYIVDIDKLEGVEQLESMIQSFKESEYKYFVMMQDTEIYTENVGWFEKFGKLYDDGCYGVYAIEN